jgi:hypothetical protein
MKQREKRGQEEIARKGEWKIGRKSKIVTNGLGSRLCHLDSTRKRPLLIYEYSSLVGRFLALSHTTD